MKKKSILAVFAAILAVAAFVPKPAHAYEQGKDIVVLLCYDTGTGDVTGVGNTCQSGTNNCIPNFCN